MNTLRGVIHGSFRKHFAEITRVRAMFAAAGIEVFNVVHVGSRRTIRTLVRRYIMK